MNTVARATLASSTVIVFALGLTGCVSQSGFVATNGRTLLTHPSTATSADALGSGVLGANTSGCVTIGDLVLVVQHGSALSPDGSITVDGKIYKSGSSIKLGGGAGSKPPGAECGNAEMYFWIG